MAARGVGRERRINESGIEQTVVAFEVKLKMPTSQQGTAAFCAHQPQGQALPWGRAGVFEETPHVKLVLRCEVFLFWQDLGRLSFSAFISHFPSARLSLERDGR